MVHGGSSGSRTLGRSKQKFTHHSLMSQMISGQHYGSIAASRSQQEELSGNGQHYGGIAACAMLP